MSRFSYVARDKAGQSVSGTVTAASLAAASKQLRQEGKFPVRLQPASPGPNGKAGPGESGRPGEAGGGRGAGKDTQSAGRSGGTKKPAGAAGSAGPGAAGSGPGTEPVKASGSGRINRNDIIYLTTQLAVMTDTGVPLADALGAIKDQTAKASLRTLLEDVAERVNSGEEFSAALARHSPGGAGARKGFSNSKRPFSAMYVAMVKAAEASGTLGVMLERVSEYLIDENETRKKIKSALTYPLAMVCFALGVTVFLLAFVLPKFSAIYNNRGATLPLPTRLLMGISEFVVGQWIFLLIGTVAAVAGLVLLFRSAGGRAWWADAKMKIPIVGGIFHKLYLARCLRTLGTLIGTGVSMLEAVQITRQVIGQGPFARLWDEVDESLRQGQQLSDPLFRSKLMPRPITQMITAGEKTGKLAQVTERVAMFCDRELKDRIKKLTALIEPIMISVMGVIIGTVVMAMLLPIFGISQVMAGGK